VIVASRREDICGGGAQSETDTEPDPLHRDNDGAAVFEGEPHWSYEGADGPEHWSTLAPQFAVCSTGLRQSPIDIPATSRPAPFGSGQLAYGETRLNVVNNGHTLQVNYDAGSALLLDGERYNLRQFHFHAPSEHLLAGHAYPMEAHFVHRAPTGELAVVGVMLFGGNDEDPMAFGPDASNGLVDMLLERMPATPAKTTRAKPSTWRSLLPGSRRYLTYRGSLTTPACDEGVRWLVMAQPVIVGASQVDRFKAVFGANVRPVQPLNGRQVGAGEFQ
jgi:carbonic anhydrase